MDHESSPGLKKISHSAGEHSFSSTLCWHNHINHTPVVLPFTTRPSCFDKTRQFSLSLYLQPLYRPVQSTHAHAWNTLDVLDGLCLTSCFCLFWLFYHKANIPCFYHCLPISHRLFFREPLNFLIRYWEATRFNFFFQWSLFTSCGFYPRKLLTSLPVQVGVSQLVEPEVERDELLLKALFIVPFWKHDTRWITRMNKESDSLRLNISICWSAIRTAFVWGNLVGRGAHETFLLLNQQILSLRQNLQLASIPRHLNYITRKHAHVITSTTNRWTDHISFMITESRRWGWLDTKANKKEKNTDTIILTAAGYWHRILFILS